METKLYLMAYTLRARSFRYKGSTKVKDRSIVNFFKPDKKYEITGQVNNACFLEGLVYFNSKWFLYYGTADSQIAVAYGG